MRRTGVFLVGAIILVGAVMLLNRPAPAELARVTPMDGSVLGSAPAEVSLTFTDGLPPRVAHVTVIRADGAPVTAGAPRLDGRVAAVAVAIPGAGSYRVGYHAVLADGRVRAGRTSFTVATTSGAPGGRAAVPPAVPAGGHAHGDGAPSAALLGLDAVLILVVVLLLCRRPAHHRDDASGGASSGHPARQEA